MDMTRAGILEKYFSIVDVKNENKYRPHLIAPSEAQLSGSISY